MEREIITEEDDKRLFQYLDEYIESLPLEVLEQSRMKIVQENGDTSIIDKAINNKIQKEQKLKNKTSLFEIIGLLFSKKNKNDYINNNEYKPYQYEEEELEEDDYFYEDID